MGKKRKYNVMKEFSMIEISAVDRPAQPDAVLSLMKRAPLVKQMALTDPMDGHTHTVALDHGNGDALSGETSWQDGHSHPWVRNLEGTIVIGAANGHTHRLGFVSKGDETNEPKPAGSSVAGDPAEDLGNPNDEDTNVTKTNDKTDDAVQKQLDDLKKANERLSKVAELSDAEKAYLKGLGEDAQTKFLDLSAEQRSAELAKADEADPVVFEEDGVQVRKSQDPTGLLTRMAKERAKDRKKLKELEEKNLDKDLTSRAQELNHLPGDLETRKSMLKSIDALPEEQRKTALESLKAQNDALESAFQNIGHRGQPDLEKGSDDDKLDALAKAHQAKNPGMTYEAAYADVLSTDEGQAIYNKRLEG